MLIGRRGGSFAGAVARSNVPVSANPRSWQAQNLAFWVPLNTSDLTLVDVPNGIRPTGGAIFEPSFGDLGLEGSLSNSTGPTFRATQPLKGPWTLAFWIRPGFASSDGANYGLLELTTGSTGFSASYLGTLSYWHVGMGSTISVYADTPAFASGDLVHVVYVGAYNGGGGNTVMQIWVNGVLRTNQFPTYSADPSAFDQSVWILGQSQAAAYNYNGTMLDVRAYSRPLTAGEIYALYDSQTRWELYDPAPRLWIPGVESAASPTTLTAGTQTVTATSPTATLSLGGLSLTSGTQTTTVTAPSVAVGLGGLSLASGTQVATATAPTGVLSLGGATVTAGTQTATVTAPTSALSLGGVTIASGTQTATVTAPTGTLSLASTLAAGTQASTVTAPTSALSLGGVTLTAGTQAIVVTVPVAELNVPGSSIAAGDQVVTVTVPVALVALGGVSLASGLQAAVLTAPVASTLQGPVSLASGVQSVTVTAPTPAIGLGGVTLSAGTQTVTVTVPVAILDAGSSSTFKLLLFDHGLRNMGRR